MSNIWLWCASHFAMGFGILSRYCGCLGFCALRVIFGFGAHLILLTVFGILSGYCGCLGFCASRVIIGFSALLILLSVFGILIGYCGRKTYFFYAKKVSKKVGDDKTRQFFICEGAN